MSNFNKLDLSLDRNNTPSVHPIIIRAYDAGNKGATAFFRNRFFIETFLHLLASMHRDVRIIIHACSIGAEAYSIAAWWEKKIQPNFGFNLDIFASDMNKKFLSFAEAGCYPIEVLQGMTETEKSWFDTDDGLLLVPDSIKKMVHFCPAYDFTKEEPIINTGFFDASLLMNALTYVSPAEQSKAIKNIAKQTKKIMCLTAFHPDQILSDIKNAEFHPFLKNQEDIHKGWAERITHDPIKSESPEYSWKLPPYEKNSIDYEWRYSSIFTRNELL